MYLKNFSSKWPQQGKTQKIYVGMVLTYLFSIIFLQNNIRSTIICSKKTFKGSFHILLNCTQKSLRQIRNPLQHMKVTYIPM